MSLGSHASACERPAHFHDRSVKYTARATTAPRPFAADQSVPGVADLPDLLPHPDQIIIDIQKGTARIVGPCKKDEKAEWDRQVGDAAPGANMKFGASLRIVGNGRCMACVI